MGVAASTYMGVKMIEMNEKMNKLYKQLDQLSKKLVEAERSAIKNQLDYINGLEAVAYVTEANEHEGIHLEEQLLRLHNLFLTINLSAASKLCFTTLLEDYTNDILRALNMSQHLASKFQGMSLQVRCIRGTVILEYSGMKQ